MSTLQKCRRLSTYFPSLRAWNQKTACTNFGKTIYRVNEMMIDDWESFNNAFNNALTLDAYRLHNTYDFCSVVMS